MTGLSRDLTTAVADLNKPCSARELMLTLLRLAALTTTLAACSLAYWLLPLNWLSITLALLGGVAYALLLIATHEMVHGTLIGQPRLEMLLACLLSWPMAWPYLTYARLHRLHHRWNGCNRLDPERTERLADEETAGGPLRDWGQRHPLIWRCVVLGGVGLIGDTAWKGRQLQRFDRQLKHAQLMDGAGVTVLHSTMLAAAVIHGEVGRYLLFWLLLERVIGAIVQFRGLIEHHGLWHQQQSPLLTQLYASRNVICSPWLNALCGGLPHHSAHHAFPWIPAQRLPEATTRIRAVLQQHNQPPLPTLTHYGAGLLLLSGGKHASASPLGGVKRCATRHERQAATEGQEHQGLQQQHHEAQG